MYYNPILLHFVVQIVPALAIRSSFNWFLCSFDMPLLLWGFLLWALSYFLQNAPGSSCVFSAPVLGSATSLLSPITFYWKIELETKIGVLGVLIAPGVSLSFSLSVDRQRKYMCVLTHYMYISICNSLYLQ